MQSGMMEEVDIYWMDGKHKWCDSFVACYLPDDNIIFINAKKMYARDSCGRNPLTHEILHHIYGGYDEVHDVCNLKIYKGMLG